MAAGPPSRGAPEYSAHGERGNQGAAFPLLSSRVQPFPAVDGVINGLESSLFPASGRIREVWSIPV